MKREPRWVAVFLKALERTGNVRLAAEGAGVDFSTAYQRRKRHADFAGAWALRLSAFGARSGCSEEDDEQGPLHQVSPGPPPQPAAREELSFRPDGKIIKGSEARWGKRAEGAFLLELTTSGNVRLAAKAAGFSTTAVYKRRLKDRRFCAAWDSAVETGKTRVQAYLVEAATRTFDPDELPIGDERAIPKVSISEAINIAKLKGGPSTSLGGNESGYEDDDGQFVTNGEMEQARGRILDRLKRIKENIAEQERETGCCHNCGQLLTGEPGDTLYRGPMARYFLLGG